MSVASAARALSGPADDSAPAVAGRRFFDAANNAWMVKVFPGEFYTTNKTDEVLVTILGSCVSACIRDPRLGIGGMNHFMLAEGEAQSWGGDSKSTRYGNFAMEKLINELIKAGASRNALEIKVFGGGNVTDTRNAIGTQNAEFVLKYLESEGLSVAAQDLCGVHPRRIHYYPATGRVVRRILAGSENSSVAKQENEYAGRLSTRNKVAGDIELFE